MDIVTEAKYNPASVGKGDKLQTDQKKLLRGSWQGISNKSIFLCLQRIEGLDLLITTWNSQISRMSVYLA